MNSLPIWVRKAIIDAVESGIAAAAALSLVVPNSLNEAKAQALVFGVAFGAAVLAALRRAVLASGLDWFRSKVLGGSPE